MNRFRYAEDGDCAELYFHGKWNAVSGTINFTYFYDDEPSLPLQGEEAYWFDVARGLLYKSRIDYWEELDAEEMETVEMKHHAMSPEILRLHSGIITEEELTMEYETLDSGERQEYASGMMRDLQNGKARFDLLFAEGVPYEDQFFTRVAGLLERGAGKYGDRNWEKANSNEELERFKASAMRHLAQWITGEQDEDHAAAVVFNLMAYETIKRKVLGEPSVQVPDAEKRVVKILDTDPEGQSMWYRTDTDGLFRCPDYPGSAALTETEIEREYGIQERFYE